MYFKRGPLFACNKTKLDYFVFNYIILWIHLEINFFHRVFIEDNKGKDKPTNEAKCYHEKTKSLAPHIGLFVVQYVL